MVNIIDVIKTAMNKVISLSSTKLTKDKFKKIFCTTYNLTVTPTPASGYTINGHNAYLVGTHLRFYFSAERSSATGAGNVNNEYIGTFVINHGGKLKNLHGIATRDYHGVMATVMLETSDLTSTTVTIKPKLCATHAAKSSFHISDILPASIDVSKY